jgi:hypothetical protein
MVTYLKRETPSKVLKELAELMHLQEDLLSFRSRIWFISHQLQIRGVQEVLLL